MKTKTIVILIMSMFIMTSGIQKSNAENLYDFTAKTQSGEELNLDYASSPDIKWNFTKFLIDREGNVVARFEPTEDMTTVENEIIELLKQ